MATKQSELIKKLARARLRLISSLEKATQQMEIYPAWKVKQVMDHITGWDVLVASSFRKYAEHQLPDMMVKEGIDQFNAVSVSDRKNLSFEQSRRAFTASREAVIQAIETMPADSLDRRYEAPWGGMCTITSVVKILSSHELEHAEQIDESINKATGGVQFKLD